MRFEGNQNNNIIYQNSFINNRLAGDELQVSITGVGFLDPKPGGGNVWDNGIIGNYWSDYLIKYSNASEIADSGIGDTAFVINENNIDRYPSIEQIIIPEFSTLTILPLLIVVFLLITILIKKVKLYSY
jgi:nitrous oxidase accessory protein NosD